MKIALKDIVYRVMALLDENAEIASERMEYCDPTTDLASLIVSLLPDAARIVLSTIDASRIDECEHWSAERALSYLGRYRQEGDDIISFPTPPGFLRLLYLRMSDWERGLTYCTARHTRFGRCVSIRYRAENSSFVVRGSTRDACVAELDYVSIPEISGSHIDLPASTLHDVCAKTAEMVRLSVN